MKRKKVSLQEHVSELPDFVLSYIFSKLSIKDLVKTSTLSKQWLHEWELRTNLHFDLQNMFDYNTIFQELPESLPLLKEVQSKFTRRVDQFLQHYPGAKICSLRVNFPLCKEHSEFVGRLISKGTAKGVERIELLFSYKNNVRNSSLRIKPCEISFHLFTGTDSSLTYLLLENCILVKPMEFSEFKSLRSLVLHLVTLDEDMLAGLFSNCTHIVDVTFNNCRAYFDLNIISQTLCHLSIVYYYCSRLMEKIDVFAPNLSSFEYSNIIGEGPILSIKAPKLSKFSYRVGILTSENIGFSGLKNVTTIVLFGIGGKVLDLIIPRLFSECLHLEDVTFKNNSFLREMKITSPKLRHLNIINCGYLCSRTPRLYIDALNLLSFDYSNHMRMLSFKSPNLLRFFWNETKNEDNPCPFDIIASLHQLENFSMIIRHSQIAILPRVLGSFQNLRQLEFFIDGAYDPGIDYFWILDITMTSPHLQKLSLTIRNSHLENPHMTTFHRKKREYVGFSHSELKYVGLHGCVGTINVIELASHLLRNVGSLMEMTFSSRDIFYVGAGEWTKGSASCACFEHNLIRDMLKYDVKEECELKIL